MDMNIAFAGAEPTADLGDPVSTLAGSAAPSRGGWRDAETTAPFRRGRPLSAGGTGVIDLQRADAATLADALDRLATSVFLVNRRAFPVHVNAGGRAMLAAKEPLRLAHGALAGATEEADRILGRVLAAAFGRGPAGGSSEISLPLTGEGGNHFVVHATPLGATAHRPVDSGGAPIAALFVRKATIDLPAAIGAVAQLYGLTPTEVRVLRAVVEVGGVAPVAALLGVAKRTVQTHLEHLFAKTGTRRQAQLVRLVAGYDSPARSPTKK